MKPSSVQSKMFTKKPRGSAAPRERPTSSGNHQSGQSFRHSSANTSPTHTLSANTSPTHTGSVSTNPTHTWSIKPGLTRPTHSGLVTRPCRISSTPEYNDVSPGRHSPSASFVTSKRGQIQAMPICPVSSQHLRTSAASPFFPSSSSPACVRPEPATSPSYWCSSQSPTVAAKCHPFLIARVPVIQEKTSYFALANLHHHRQEKRQRLNTPLTLHQRTSAEVPENASNTSQMQDTVSMQETRIIKPTVISTGNNCALLYNHKKFNKSKRDQNRKSAMAIYKV